LEWSKKIALDLVINVKLRNYHKYEQEWYSGKVSICVIEINELHLDDT